MSNELKMQLFEKMEELYQLGNTTTYDGRNYFEQSEGAYAMLTILGIQREYIKWSVSKEKERR